MTTPTTFSYLHSHWISCDFYSVDSCWALLATRNRQRPVLKEWKCSRSTKWDEKKKNCETNVRWTEICRRREGKRMVFNFSFHIWEDCVLNFVGFEEFSLSSSIGILMWDRFGLVCLKVTECLFSERRDGREKVKVKSESEPEKRCSIVDKHVLPAACSHRFTIHLVHCVFSKNLKREKKKESALRCFEIKHG